MRPIRTSRPSLGAPERVCGRIDVHEELRTLGKIASPSNLDVGYHGLGMSHFSSPMSRGKSSLDQEKEGMTPLPLAFTRLGMV